MSRFSILFLSLIIYAPVLAQQYQSENGLFYEKPVGADTANPDFFNRDNLIYKPGRKFYFTYQLVKGDDSLKVAVKSPSDTKTATWDFVKQSSEDSLTIAFVCLDVQRGYGGMDDLFPDYSQTIISQQYLNPNRQILFEGSTGLIENKINLWVHPFRGKYFSVLQFSPYPYVKFPPANTSSWKWNLTGISERWSDPRIIEYTSKQNAVYEYRLLEKRKIKTFKGILSCFVIRAIGKISIGETALTAFFHPGYGFVRMEYDNIDGSRLILDLAEVNF